MRRQFRKKKTRALFTVEILSVFTILCLYQKPAKTCTSFLITKGASTDGSTMITYAADAHVLYGELYYRPAAEYPEGAMMEIKDWDSGKKLGKIKQVRKTYSVVGNMNEHQLAIGETTFGGREELKNEEGGIDYGSLIYVTLQRAKTAREAIKIMGELVEEYGYYSKGESFSIADPNEVWFMDLIGKGPDEKGAVWVACKVPDGYVSAHANHARISTFPQDDPEKCVFSKDVISFARKKGYFKGDDKDFSFVAAYAPANCRDLRVREGRVWSMFRRVAPSLKIPSDYVKCKKGAEPLPLWIKPDKKLSVHDVMELMRDHFEGTEFDLSKGVGAGPYELPYRWRPLTWEYEGKKYVNERATATQQTGFSFVSQSRSNLPDPIGGILWFSVDDAASTVYVPMYAGITEPPKPYAVGTGSFTEFSWDSAFWIFNWVANFAYSRYKDIIVDIRKVQGDFEKGFFEKQKEIESKAVALHKKSPAKARAFLTEYSKKTAEEVVTRWKKLGVELLMKYLDGNVRDENGKVTHPGYPKHWYARIVKERGDHFRLPAEDPKLTDAQRAALPPEKETKEKSDKTAPAETSGEKKATAKEDEEKKKEPSGPCGCSFKASHGPSQFSTFFLALLVAGFLFFRKRMKS